MVTDVTPSPVHYRLLSEHFQACAELSEQEREEYLSGSNVGDVSLREELRSLLQYHGQPADGPGATESAPSASARPAFSASGQFLKPFLLLAASTVLLALAAGAWGTSRLEASIKAEGLCHLQEILDSRTAAVQAWKSRTQDLVRTVVEDPSLVAHIAVLTEAARQPGPAGEELRRSPSFQEVSRRLSQAPEGLAETGFCVFDAAGTVLCSSAERMVGRPLSPAGAAGLWSRGLGEWSVSKPSSDHPYGVAVDREKSRPVMIAGGPFRNPQGQIVAYGAFFFPAASGFYPLLAPSGPVRILAFDEKGLLLNNLNEPDDLLQAGLLSAEGDPTALRVRLLDPGRELKAGEGAESTADPAAPTKMCLSAIHGRAGSDGSGYRNVVGRRVAGAWTWLPELQMGLGVEQDLAGLLSPMRPVRTAFAVMAAVPALLAVALFVACGRFRFSRPRGRETIGFYVVERPIGQGGMGDVFLATHSILSRPAAIKVLRDPRPTGATVERFKREARMASRLGHPNSIQIFDYGETPDGRLYYAMEYVDGLNLAQLLTLEGPLSVARSLYLLRQISGALEEAHALGLLHRDLKPSNIMVGRKGGLGDVVKILDFGIASSVSGTPEDMTRSTNLVGTPAYIAPERIRRPHQLDFRSDVYSFGGVAFHLLTGRSIFEGPGPTELIYQVLTSKRPSPSKLRGDPLPEALEGLILECLAIEPELRPSSMSEVTETLRSIEPPESWSQDEARAWWGTNREKVARFKGAST